MKCDYQYLMRVKGSDKQIYVVPDGTTGFFSHIEVDMIMCTEKFYNRNKYFLDPLLKEDGEFLFI